MREIEFSFGDERLKYRAEKCFSKLMLNPSASFPKVFSHSSELEGFYRFINNPRASYEEISDAVKVQSLGSILKQKEVLAIHDTTHVVPNSKTESIKEFSWRKGGFLAHVSLLASARQSHEDDRRELFGVGALTLWSRTGPRLKPGSTNERRCWLDHVKILEEDCPEQTEYIHVMDREGDMYPLWSELMQKRDDGRQMIARFVIRAKCNRTVVGDNVSGAALLFEHMKEAPVLASRKVFVSRREENPCPRSQKTHPAREKGREAKLLISACRVEIKRAETSTVKKRSPFPTTTLNVVRVFEENFEPKNKENLIEWILLTTEPIESAEQVLKIVDIYKARWTIEEFFKAVKTGCKIEERLLSDAQAWYKLFALCLPVGCQLLNLRLASNDPLEVDLLERKYLSHQQWEILQLKSGEYRIRLEHYSDAQALIARMGGHIKSNGPPGWITLFRGFQELLQIEKGWILARTHRDM